MADNIEAAFAQLPEANRAGAALMFTAHSVPLAMASTSAYEQQLHEACQLAAGQIGRKDWKLVYQSRSGSPRQAWLGPDINDALREIRQNGVTHVVVAPIGFISDHMEVLYDLDTEARGTAEGIGLHMVRAGTAGRDARFVRMIRELIAERFDICPRRALGRYGPSHDVCALDCCPGPEPMRR